MSSKISLSCSNVQAFKATVKQLETAKMEQFLTKSIIEVDAQLPSSLVMRVCNSFDNQQTERLREGKLEEAISTFIQDHEILILQLNSNVITSLSSCLPGMSRMNKYALKLIHDKMLLTSTLELNVKDMRDKACENTAILPDILQMSASIADIGTKGLESLDLAIKENETLKAEISRLNQELDQSYSDVLKMSASVDSGIKGLDDLCIAIKENETLKAKISRLKQQRDQNYRESVSLRGEVEKLKNPNAGLQSHIK